MRPCLEDGETDLGVALVDIGGARPILLSSPMALSGIRSCLPIGGNLITSDIAIGLRLPVGVAEELKITYGHCDPQLLMRTI